MSPSHTYTVGVVAAAAAASLVSADDDDDDNDICPVCDGECTCDNRPRSSFSPSQGHALHVSSHRASNVAAQSAQPSIQPTLKIRLTVPPSILGKRRAIEIKNKKSRPSAEPNSLPARDVELSPNGHSSTKTTYNSHSMQDVIVTKRRGRPLKPVPSKLIISPHIKGDVASTFSGPSSSFSQSPSKRRNTLHPTHKKPQLRKSSATRQSKAGVPISRKPPRRRQVVDDLSSDLTDIASVDDDDDGEGQFPTFVSASDSLSSSASSDCDSSSSDSESSIEAEEEDYIISEQHDKARVRREHIGDEGHSKRRDARDSWIIRPRKKSVDLSDVEMGGDSDGVSQDDDDDDDEDDEDDDDEAEADRHDPGVRYVGVATGWSEDEESSFDADLFFANLTDSTADDDDSSQAGEEDAEDLSAAEASVAALSPHDVTKQELDNLLFEVTEAWDGKIVFANSLREGQGILDIDFEVNAAQLIIEATPTTTSSTDLDVAMTDGEDKEYGDGEGDGDDDDDCGLDQSGGDTTEEELVGENGLPTDHAMKLFRFPSTVSAIDPMSTLSPTASPVTRTHRRVKSQVSSPKPADILAGKIFWNESDGRAETPRNTRGSRSLSLRGYRPAMGHFDPVDPNPQKRVIIDHFSKDIPSPFRRTRRGRGGSRVGSISRVHESGTSRSSSFRGPRSSVSSLQIMSPETSPNLPPAEAMDLNDVLDVSFFDSDPLGDQSPSNASSETESKNHLRNLSRWDVISVGAFRQTLETTGNSENSSGRWSSAETSSSTKGFSYGHGMKKNSLGTVLFNNKSSTSANQSPSPTNNGMNVLGSPVILPVRDGNRTPTKLSQTQITQDPPNQQQHSPQKKRKELRREKNKPFKSSAPVPHKHQQYQHRHHQHHPNMKSRGSSSLQRTNFFSSPSSSVPSLNI